MPKGTSSNSRYLSQTDTLQKKIGRDFERVIFIDYDLGGVTAVGWGFPILSRTVVGHREPGFCKTGEAYPAFEPTAAKLGKPTVNDWTAFWPGLKRKT
jgi:hypothetical protein